VLADSALCRIDGQQTKITTTKSARGFWWASEREYIEAVCSLNIFVNSVKAILASFGII